MSQSSNDVVPTAIHVAAALALNERLLPALAHLSSVLQRRALELSEVVKTGRTHLMDATPVRLGQEFAGYARQVELAVRRVDQLIAGDINPMLLGDGSNPGDWADQNGNDDAQFRRRSGAA